MPGSPHKSWGSVPGGPVPDQRRKRAFRGATVPQQIYRKNSAVGACSLRYLLAIAAEAGWKRERPHQSARLKSFKICPITLP
jgi:hypothetical protein